jgi:hypothetical protein
MTRIVLAAALGLITSSAALASETCTAPTAEWQPEQALRQKLETTGWKIDSIEIDDGCYEVEGTDPCGKRAETTFNPKSLEPVKSESDNDDDDEEDEDDDDDEDEDD